MHSNFKCLLSPRISSRHRLSVAVRVRPRAKLVRWIGSRWGSTRIFPSFSEASANECTRLCQIASRMHSLFPPIEITCSNTPTGYQLMWSQAKESTCQSLGLFSQSYFLFSPGSKLPISVIKQASYPVSVKVKKADCRVLVPWGWLNGRGVLPLRGMKVFLYNQLIEQQSQKLCNPS